MRPCDGQAGEKNLNVNSFACGHAAKVHTTQLAAPQLALGSQCTSTGHGMAAASGRSQHKMVSHQLNVAMCEAAGLGFVVTVYVCVCVCLGGRFCAKACK